MFTDSDIRRAQSYINKFDPLDGLIGIDESTREFVSRTIINIAHCCCCSLAR